MADGAVQPEDAESPLILTVDIGTSSTRCIVYDGRGRSVNGWECHRPYEADTTPDGGVTLDADFVVRLTCHCLDDVLKTVGEHASDIGAVACDTFWHSLVGVSEAGEAVTPVLTWADTRSVDAAAKLCEQLDPAEVHARTGAEIHPSYLPAKLLWLHDTHREEFDRAKFWMSMGEYFYLALFGERAVSISMASGTGLFDQHACAYDQQILKLLPIEQEQLSPIRDYDAAMTGLKGECAERWPSLKSVPWYLPVGDGAANNIGSGGYADQDMVVMIGTSGALRVVRATDDFEIPHGLWSYRVDAHRIVQGGALSSGGNVWAWLTTILHAQDVESLERRVADLSPDSHGLTVLPFLAGERSPNWNPRARSALVGATLHTTDVEIVCAFLESTTYEFAMVYDILKQSLSSVRGIIGSGAALVHSPAWMQIMTDVLGLPVTTCAAQEATSRGAALLALQALGKVHALTEIPTPLGKTFKPDRAKHDVYRRAMERQKALYHLLIDSPAGS